MILRMILEGYIEYSISSILNVRDVRHKQIIGIIIIDGMENYQRQDFVRVFNCHARGSPGLPLFRVVPFMVEVFNFRLGKSNQYVWIDILRTQNRQQTCFIIQRDIHASQALYSCHSNHGQGLFVFLNLGRSITQPRGNHLHGYGAAF